MVGEKTEKIGKGGEKRGPLHLHLEEEGEEDMGILYDDVVLLNHSEREGDPSVITVNCPDKTGLGSDLCRIILFFGLTVVRVGMLLPLSLLYS